MTMKSFSSVFHLDYIAPYHIIIIIKRKKNTITNVRMSEKGKSKQYIYITRVYSVYMLLLFMQKAIFLIIVSLKLYIDSDGIRYSYTYYKSRSLIFLYIHCIPSVYTTLYYIVYYKLFARIFCDIKRVPLHV